MQLLVRCMQTSKKKSTRHARINAPVLSVEEVTSTTNMDRNTGGGYDFFLSKTDVSHFGVAGGVVHHDVLRPNFVVDVVVVVRVVKDGQTTISIAKHQVNGVKLPQHEILVWKGNKIVHRPQQGHAAPKQDFKHGRNVVVKFFGTFGLVVDTSQVHRWQPGLKGVVAAKVMQNAGQDGAGPE